MWRTHTQETKTRRINERKIRLNLEVKLLWEERGRDIHTKMWMQELQTKIAEILLGNAAKQEKEQTDAVWAGRIHQQLMANKMGFVNLVRSKEQQIEQNGDRIRRVMNEVGDINKYNSSPNRYLHTV